MVAAAVAVAVTAAGCGDTATVGQWVSSTQFGEHFGILQADNARIGADLRADPPPPSTKADCSVLVADLSNIAGELPTPDSRLTTLLDAAYHSDQAAASDCVAGMSGDRAKLTQANAERVRAEHQLVAALARIATVTGSVPPTSTTTTIPGGIFG